MVLITAAQINHFDKQAGLRGFPKSDQWFVGIDFFLEQRFDVAAGAFHQGATQQSCVACMFYYAELQRNADHYHLALPWTLEGAIRGHIHCMKLLVVQYYTTKTLVLESEHVEAEMLRNYWIQQMVEFSEERNMEKADDIKSSSSCSSCCKNKESEDTSINNDNNSNDGDDDENNDENYMGGEQYSNGDWKHLHLLRQYNKPQDAIEIRKALLRGEDPKALQKLQTVRTKLGLNRQPTTEDNEVVALLGQDCQSCQNRNRYLMARTDGTVQIGSTPKLI